MKTLLLLSGALALALATGPAAAAPGPKSLAEDVAEIATNLCAEVQSGRLRWDPSDLAAETKLFRSLGLKPGIPGFVLDGFAPHVAATFNRSVLAFRENGASHVVVAIGGQVPGCRVSVAGPPGMVSGPEVAGVLQKTYGWSALPEFTKTGGPVERLSFGRRVDGGTLRLDVLVMTEGRDNFRMMAFIISPPTPPKAPAGF